MNDTDGKIHSTIGIFMKYLFFLIIIFRGRISIFRKHYSLFRRHCLLDKSYRYTMKNWLNMHFLSISWNVLQSKCMNILFQFANAFDMYLFNVVYNITCVLSTCMCLCSVQCSVEAVMIFKIKWKYR